MHSSRLVVVGAALGVLVLGPAGEIIIIYDAI